MSYLSIGFIAIFAVLFVFAIILLFHIVFNTRDIYLKLCSISHFMNTSLSFNLNEVRNNVAHKNKKSQIWVPSICEFRKNVMNELETSDSFDRSFIPNEDNMIKELENFIIKEKLTNNQSSKQDVQRIDDVEMPTCGTGIARMVDIAVEKSILNILKPTLPSAKDSLIFENTLSEMVTTLKSLSNIKNMKDEATAAASLLCQHPQNMDAVAYFLVEAGYCGLVTKHIMKISMYSDIVSALQKIFNFPEDFSEIKKFRESINEFVRYMTRLRISESEFDVDPKHFQRVLSQLHFSTMTTLCVLYRHIFTVYYYYALFNKSSDATDNTKKVLADEEIKASIRMSMDRYTLAHYRNSF